MKHKKLTLRHCRHACCGLPFFPGFNALKYRTVISFSRALHRIMTHQMNSSCVVIGLDVGTTSVSAVAITQSGVLLKAVSINHEATVSRLPFDCAEQDPDRLLAACVVALEQLSPAIAGSRIAGIGLTGQMHSCILLDQFNGPLSNVVTWQDRRSLRSVNGGTLLQQLQAAAT